MSMSSLRWLAVAAVTASCVSCVETTGAQRIVGPDGTKMLHVHCGNEQAACFQIAGELCPYGYDLSPIFDPREGNFLVRCRGALAARPVKPSPLAIRANATQADPRSTIDGWPPAEVATPSEPWPKSPSDKPATSGNAAGVGLGY